MSAAEPYLSEPAHAIADAALEVIFREARTLRRCDAPLLTLRTDRDWIADVVRFVASRRRGALAGRR